MSLVSIDASRIKDIKKLAQLSPDETQKSLYLSINTTIRFAFAEASRRIRKEVNLPQDYIGSAAKGNRLRISQFATLDNPLAVLTADQRPVSLARYAKNKTLFGKDGVMVEVTPGKVEKFDKAFLLPLRSGKALTDDNYNLGFAIRLKPGEQINKRNLVQYSKAIRAGRKKPDDNLFLLYGPSVDQVFTHVREEFDDVVFAKFESEFLRQYGRLT